MIKHIFIFLALCFFTEQSLAQIQVLEIPIQYESTFYERKESLAISNEETGELVIFIEDSYKTHVILLDKKFKIVSQLITERLPQTFKSFIGHQITDRNNYSIFFANKGDKKFSVLNLDF